MNDAPAADRPQAIGELLSRHLRVQVGGPVEVHALKRLSGGTSNETWAFDLHTRRHGHVEVVPLVFRRTLETGLSGISVEAEFSLMNALHRLGLPVPRPWLCAVDDSERKLPFLVVGRVAGEDVRKLLARPGHQVDRIRTGTALVQLQARIHALDWKTQLGGVLPSAGERSALGEIEKWAGAIESAASPPRPLLHAALDWLRAHAPAIERLCLVHGDFKANNILFAAGGVSAVIDWEMSHIGDPVEDLAWTMLWRTDYDLVHGMLAPDDYVAAYEAASGTPIEPGRLRFWRMFSDVKLAAIFLKGLERKAGQAAVRPTMILLGRAIPYLEQQIAACLLAETAEQVLP